MKRQEYLKATITLRDDYVVSLTHCIALTGTGITLEMIPYNGEAELSLTRDELYNVHFLIDMPESLPVKPSIRTLMSYPSGMVENVNDKFGPYINYNARGLDHNTGKKKY